MTPPVFGITKGTSSGIGCWELVVTVHVTHDPVSLDAELENNQICRRLGTVDRSMAPCLREGSVVVRVRMSGRSAGAKSQRPTSGNKP